MDDDDLVPVPGLAELPHLATFMRAAERGSFTAAAADFGITQAAVSQRIAALEKELRASLFDRRAGRISLTDAGRQLYELARRILELHQEARTRVGGLHPAVSGELPLSASSVPGECYLPALLSAFGVKYPLVRVQATVGDSGSVIDDVVKGRSPLGLIGQKAEKASLESRTIGVDTLVLVVSAEHPWAAGRAASLAAVLAEPLIIREPGSGTRCALRKGLEAIGRSLDDLNVRLQVSSNAAIKDAVRRGVGVAFLSEMAVRREVEAGELRAVAVRGLRLTRDLYLIAHRRRPLSPAAATFARFLDEHPLKPDRR
jgi:DNA-binding transcriptional LysR family regulator